MQISEESKYCWALQGWVSKTFMSEGYTESWGNLLHCCTVLWGKSFFSSPLWSCQFSLCSLTLLQSTMRCCESLALSSQCPTCSKGKAALRCCQSLPFSLLKKPCPSTSFWGAGAPTPDLGILVLLHWITPLCTTSWASLPPGQDFAFVGIGKISHSSHQPAHPACLGPAVRQPHPWAYRSLQFGVICKLVKSTQYLLQVNDANI